MQRSFVVFDAFSDFSESSSSRNNFRILLSDNNIRSFVWKCIRLIFSCRLNNFWKRRYFTRKCFKLVLEISKVHLSFGGQREFPCRFLALRIPCSLHPLRNQFHQSNQNVREKDVVKRRIRSNELESWMKHSYTSYFDKITHILHYPQVFVHKIWDIRIWWYLWLWINLLVIGLSLLFFWIVFTYDIIISCFDIFVILFTILFFFSYFLIIGCVIVN